jgi:hypothetical protein
VTYAETAYEMAVSERSQTGSVSQGSRERLTKIHEALNLLLRHQRETERAQMSKNPWNDAEWRALWHAVAVDLDAMKFVPLPG